MKMRAKKGRRATCSVCDKDKYVFELETDNGELQEWCLHCIEEESDILLRANYD